MKTKVTRCATVILLGAFLLVATGCASSRSSRGGSRANQSSRRLADPLRPVNEVMFEFNDGLYFWVLRPAAKGYRTVVPEAARTGVRNFFDNVTTPVRVANCLLQLNLKGTGVEISRFGINTTVGVLGFGNPAGEWGLKERQEDFDQTLAMYGIGQGIYLVLPVFGPSSLRGVVGMAGDILADPLTYYPEDTLLRAGIGAYDRVNRISLRIEDIDEIRNQLAPYAAMKNGYRQHREHLVEENRGESLFYSADDAGESH